MLTVIYAECRYAECHYAECRGDLKLASIIKLFTATITSVQ
jgi:hypothetical protein